MRVGYQGETAEHHLAISINTPSRALSFSETLHTHFDFPSKIITRILVPFMYIQSIFVTNSTHNVHAAWFLFWIVGQNARIGYSQLSGNKPPYLVGIADKS